MNEPGYLALYRSGELMRRAEAAQAVLEHCTLCPHCCGVDRHSGERGICHMGDLPKVSSWNLHRWEEPPLSGKRGSGTIFFSGCTGRCSFCQNYPISQLGYGNVVDAQRLAEMMIELVQQRKRVIEIPVNYFNRSQSLQRAYQHPKTFFRFLILICKKRLQHLFRRGGYSE